MVNREVSEDQLEIDSWPISNRTKNILVKNNLTLESISGLYLEDLKALKGLGSTGIIEIRDYLYSKHKIVFKSKPKEKKKKVEDHTAAKEVVGHLLAAIDSKTIDWPRQILAANQLLKKNSLEVILSVKPKPGIYSIVWYLADYGQRYISENIPVKIVVDTTKQDNKIEEVYSPDEELELSIDRPKSLRDFLKIK